MPTKTPYRTKQLGKLLKYLQATPGQHHTAAQIHQHFADGGTSIGIATIYRQLERLVEEGTVKKYLLDTGDSACFEYIGRTEACAGHFHCKCEVCGRLIHMDCDELQLMRAHLLEHHGFEWNAGKTVFYGICDQCRQKG